MHTARTANDTLEILWNNYLELSEPEELDGRIRKNTPVQTLEIAVWLATIGYFIAAWCLWECYARNVCAALYHKKSRATGESTVQWVGRSLEANGLEFSDKDWFLGANALRNLIAHSGGRVHGSRGKHLLDKSRKAFPGIDTWKDGYVKLTDDHVAELQHNIEEFIRATAESLPDQG